MSEFAGRYSGQKADKAPEKSNFSHTCNLLSKYMKKNGSFGDLSIGITGYTQATEKSPSTMNLFPVTGNSSAVKKSKPETAEMTIFYSGKMMVFNDIPADKFKEIITFAADNESSQYHHSIPATDFTNNLVVADLSIARKSSLTRFFEKRKNRLTARAPYSTSSNKASALPNLTNSKAWLGLAA
ncbi:protein TIFY 10A-like [Impatiens glandulifera]|uniref:protein TIFY 10A-like n=1 Tax=Impatiens glandulifera TaxID=253017 RepID=UPI001FB0A4EC|nr:protein TIFY 10A-like [Impatiens glandulifera]